MSAEVPTDSSWVCEFVIQEGGSASGARARQRCVSLVAPGSRYCPVHRKQFAAPKPREKHDLSLDVLPWKESSFGGK